MVRILCSLLLITASGMACAQGKSNSLKGVPVRERIVTGGGMGLGFSSAQDFVSVSPIIGYRLTQKLTAGVNLTYMYVNYKFYDIKVNNYGFGPFTRFTVYRNIFLQAEYEHLNYEFPIAGTRETARQGFNSFLAGGGFIQPLGRNAGLYFMALYNFSYSPTKASPYDSPLVLRAGVAFGF
jgi:hypothetical protein